MLTLADEWWLVQLVCISFLSPASVRKKIPKFLRLYLPRVGVGMEASLGSSSPSPPTNSTRHEGGELGDKSRRSAAVLSTVNWLECSELANGLCSDLGRDDVERLRREGADSVSDRPPEIRELGVRGVIRDRGNGNAAASSRRLRPRGERELILDGGRGNATACSKMSRGNVPFAIAAAAARTSISWSVGSTILCNVKKGKKAQMFIWNEDFSVRCFSD